MKKFNKGYIYLVKARNGYWYQVRQTGMKSWDAMSFGNLKLHKDDVLRHGNGTSLYENLGVEERCSFLDIQSEQGLYRKAMYTILLHGHYHVPAK